MIYILGAGGFAPQVLQIFVDLQRDDEVLGFLEDDCQRRGNMLNGKPIDDTSILKDLDRSKVKLVCAIGTPLRKRLIEHTKRLGYEYDTIVHPNVVKSKWTTLGEGNLVCAGCILMPQVTIANQVTIDVDSSIGHHVSIGAYTFIGPKVHISGKASIGDECFIGVGATTIHDVSIGSGSFIGAGAVVTEDIPENSLAVGVPAKVIRRLNETEWKKLI